METITDKLETMILMALDANQGDQGDLVTYRSNKTGIVHGAFDTGELLRFSEMHPSSAYTVDMTDQERLISTTPDYLVSHPAEIIGDEAESIILDENKMKWIGLRRLNRPPRGCACLGKASYWYEFHLRVVNADGTGWYRKRIVPLSSKGTALPATVQGAPICNPSIEGVSIIMLASIIEDAHRSNTMLAAVKDATEIKFPVPIGDYKAVFADRDGPLAYGRRKAILHWVVKHLRHSTRGKEHEVKQHTRGIQEFTIDGLKIRLSPN